MGAAGACRQTGVQGLSIVPAGRDQHTQTGANDGAAFAFDDRARQRWSGSSPDCERGVPDKFAGTGCSCCALIPQICTKAR
jgi:hypothetical protein